MDSTALRVVCVLVALCAVAAQKAEVAPSFEVSLDAPAMTRWDAVIQHFHAVYPAIEAWMDKLIPEWLQSLLAPVFADIDKYLGPYADELRGIAQTSGMELGKIVAMNLIYSFTAACTSIVAELEDGHMLHARNLDYDIPDLRNLTASVAFTRGGKTLYHCTVFAGYAGCLTGMRPGGFSVSVDQRMAPNTTIVDNIFALLAGASPVSFFLRSTLENVTSFAAAKKAITNEYLAAPVYIITAGTNAGEGAVITRDRKGADVWDVDTAMGAWYRLETNYDHWLPAPSSDNRRAVANKGMSSLGRSKLSLQGMYDVLSTPPVLNRGTKYTALMSAHDGSFTTYTRWDAPPNVTYTESMLPQWLRPRK